MNKGMLVILLVIFTILINIPFGYLRGRSKKYSFKWLLYIHLPVPLVIYLRYTAGVSYYFIPLMLAAAVFGQFTGGKLPAAK